MNIFTEENIRTFILCLSLIVTFWIYKANKWADLRNAASLVVLQIKNTERNIDSIKKNYITSNNKINWEKISDMDTIFEEDYWEKYRHLFIYYLGENDFNQLDVFFSNARKVKLYQTKVRDFTFLRSEIQTKKIYEIGYETILNSVAKTGKCSWQYMQDYNTYFMPGKHAFVSDFQPDFLKNFMVKSVNSTIPVIGSAGFDKLELIVKKKSWFTLWISFQLRN